MRKITICRLLNENADKFYPLLEEGNHTDECVDVIESILDNNIDSINLNDKERCLTSLRNSAKHLNRFLSTLSTWLTCEKVLK